jgi:hypothetical protein
MEKIIRIIGNDIKIIYEIRYNEKKCKKILIINIKKD